MGEVYGQWCLPDENSPFYECKPQRRVASGWRLEPEVTKRRALYDAVEATLYASW